jgi:hypothetical protein
MFIGLVLCCVCTCLHWLARDWDTAKIHMTGSCMDFALPLSARLACRV